MPEKSNTRMTRQLIDPLYAAFTRNLLDTVSSSAFYAYFMQALENAQTELAFSNRHIDKQIDDSWIQAIEDTIPHLQHIIDMPRVVIQEEELLVNVAAAKRCTPDTIRHLSQNAQLVEDYNRESGEVRPSRLMQKLREEQVTMYENQVAYTVMEQSLRFVKTRYEALSAALDQEEGARLKLHTHFSGPQEELTLDLNLHILQHDNALETDARHAGELERISRLYRLLGNMASTAFAREMAKKARVHGNIIRTNVLRSNRHYRPVAELYDMLRNYHDIGYYIRVRDQSPEITPEFQQNIFHGILFQYMTLKSYLADEADRCLPGTVPGREQLIEPKFIRQIVEEQTRDYDQPELEIRKVLVEEMTKADLMREEAAERRRLIEERQQRKRQEAARQKAEREAEKARLRAQREEERQRLRQQEEERQRLARQEEQFRQQQQQRQLRVLQQELEHFAKNLERQLFERQSLQEHQHKAPPPRDYSDAVLLMQAEEERHHRQQQRQQLALQQEQERQEQERLVAEQAALQQEQERQEQERLAREKAEEEQALASLSVYLVELRSFCHSLPQQQLARQQADAYWRELMQEAEQ